MKLVAALALVAVLTAAAAHEATESEDQPGAVFVQRGQDFTCTAREGCLVLNRPGLLALVNDTKAKAAAACRKGAI